MPYPNTLLNFYYSPNIINVIPKSGEIFMLEILSCSFKQNNLYFSYVNVSLTALKLILRNFAPVIKSNVTAPPSIGVDISREERFDITVAPIHNSLSHMNFHV